MAEQSLPIPSCLGWRAMSIGIMRKPACVTLTLERSDFILYINASCGGTELLPDEARLFAKALLTLADEIDQQAAEKK